MRNKKTLAALLAGGLITAITLPASGVAAQDDLNCGDPGTSPNMPITDDDPNRLDADNDGIGCEDPNAPMPDESGDPETPTTTAPAPETPDAPPAPAVEADPDFTG